MGYKYIIIIILISVIINVQMLTTSYILKLN